MITNTALRLQTTCNEAYDRFTEYCNQSVHYVIAVLVDSQWPLELADDMINHITSESWQEVDDQTASQLANQGVVVVAGLKGGANGHVVVVYPGDPKPQLGFNCNGTYYPPGKDGVFPLSMSTSESNWCGTRSRGDKTIRDAWTAADWPYVRRWRQP